MAGGMCGRGMCGGGACVMGGHAWHRGMHVWCGVHGRGHAWQEGVHGRGACMAEETATAAKGTHPTGMHSCFVNCV